jgi:hypothetical protein
MAALVFRREQLLQELHRERIRHDMIMCELAETERVNDCMLSGAGRLAWKAVDDSMGTDNVPHVAVNRGNFLVAQESLGASDSSCLPTCRKVAVTTAAATAS